MDKYITIKEAKDIINLVDDENKFYWLNELVRRKLISKGLAGCLCIYFKLL